MEQVIRRFNIITLRPHWAQYIISQGLMCLVSMVLFLVAGHEAITFKAPFLILGTITTLMMLYGCLYLCKLRFIVSSEQLIIQHGIFHRTSDYIELYRIVDFSESRDILEQLFGLKTVSIYEKVFMKSPIGNIYPMNKDRWNFDQRWWTVALMAFVLLWLSLGRANAQIASSNPLEYVALAEGNELINGQIKTQIDDQQKTALLQNGIAAEFTMIHKWEKKYNSYLKTVDGYASTLKACTTLYDDGVRIFINLCNLRKAMANNPQGIVATMSMNNLYIETATELVTIYTTLRDAIAKGGTENMLTGAERSKTLWALNDRLDAFNKKLTKLYLSIRYYTMTDVWNSVTAGMLDRTNGDIALQAHRRWIRCARAAY